MNRHRIPPLLCLAAALLPLWAADYTSGTIPLGSIGGIGTITNDKSYVEIDKLTPGAPGASAGLLEHDLLIGAFGDAFKPTPGEGCAGTIQDLAMAIERAEAGDGKLPIRVIRPGKGEMEVAVKLAPAGAFGPAFPLGSEKFAKTYEAVCKKIVDRGPDNGFNGPWFGLALLGHPHWKDQFAHYLLAVRDIALKKFSSEKGNDAFAYAPVEDLLLDGKTKNPNYAANSGGPNNWELGSWTMFLAEYRRKTKDASVDKALQRAAEMCANRIQWWKQPPLNANGYSPGFADIAGIVAHGGVTGDYIHLGWGGGINITGVHIFCGLMLARQAGVNMSARPRDGHYFGFPEPPAGAVPPGMEHKDFSLEEKIDMQLAWLYRCSGDQGAVGYCMGQGGSPGDAAARTAATLFGLCSSGRAFDKNDLQRIARMKSYLPLNYDRLMECHAYTHGGHCFYQLALPFFDERSQRYFMENWRLYYVLSRQPDGGVAYMGSRGNIGGDYYLDNQKVTETAWAMTGSIAYGSLPYMESAPPRSHDRIYVGFAAPYVRWPKLEARAARVTGCIQDFRIEVVDSAGAPLKPGQFTATWSSPESGVAFASANAKSPLTTTVTFPSAAMHRILLTVAHGDYTVQEPIDVEVLDGDGGTLTDAQKAQRPVIATSPAPAEATLGSSACFAVEVSGRGPLSYDWRLDGVPLWPKVNTPMLNLKNIGGGQAGSYDCVVTGADGVAISKAATLTVSDSGAIAAGGLWCEEYTNQLFVNATTLERFISSARFPRWSDASRVLAGACAIEQTPGHSGRRLTGWVKAAAAGSYQFFVTGTGAMEVSVGTSDSFHSRRVVVTYTGEAKPCQWSAGARSKPVFMEAGKRYAIEVVHVATGKSGNCAVAWRLVTGTAGARKDDPAPADGSPGMPADVFDHRVGGLYDGMKTESPSHPSSGSGKLDG